MNANTVKDLHATRVKFQNSTVQVLILIARALMRLLDEEIPYINLHCSANCSAN